MSSFTRNVQRAAKRMKFFKGRGQWLGAPTRTTAKDFVARTKRELKRGEIKSEQG